LSIQAPSATSRELAMHDHDGMIDQQKNMMVGLFFLIPILPDFCVEY
jgi:hypothetical protein